MAKVMASPAVQEALLPLGADSTVMSPVDFDAYVKADEKRQVPVIKALNLTIN
eukprot:gene15361-18765_t